MPKSGKLRLFIENFIIYGFGGIISRIIPLIMIPIITRLMPNSEYFGISDLSNTIVSIGISVAVMGMGDAMYRMFFEKDDFNYKKTVCSTALIFNIITSFVVFSTIFVLRNTIARHFFKTEEYAYIASLSATAVLVSATNLIISMPTRMQNKRRIFLITNTLSPLIGYMISIPLLLTGFYTVALPIAAIISGIFIEITFIILNHGWFSYKLFDKNLLKTLLKLALPLLPNFLIYWIFSSCDKVMIANMLNVGETGIYAVGSKLGHASQLIYTAFAGGWQYFAFSTMRDKNQVETNSKIYEYLGLLSFIATAFICVVSYPFFRVIFSDEYLEGFIIAPYLFLAPLLLMLYQTGGNQFLIIKKSWPGMFILSTGAIVNIVLNYFLIPIIGIEGAAIATLSGYVVACVIDIIVLIKLKLMKPRIRFLWVSLLMVVFIISWRLLFPTSLFLGMVMWLLFTISCLLLYRDDLFEVGIKIKWRYLWKNSKS